MWIGLAHFTPEETDDDGRDVVVVGYEARRAFTIGAHASALPEVIALLRAAAGNAGWTPRCRSCSAPVTVPPLDEPEEARPCASA